MGTFLPYLTNIVAITSGRLGAPDGHGLTLQGGARSFAVVVTGLRSGLQQVSEGVTKRRGLTNRALVGFPTLLAPCCRHLACHLLVDGSPHENFVVGCTGSDRL